MVLVKDLNPRLNVDLLTGVLGVPDHFLGEGGNLGVFPKGRVLHNEGPLAHGLGEEPVEDLALLHPTLEVEGGQGLAGEVLRRLHLEPKLDVNRPPISFVTPGLSAAWW